MINTGKILRPGGGESVDLDIITAVAADVKAGKVIVDKDGNPIEGTMAAVAGRTVTPGTANQTVISAGQWASGNIVVAGDADLVAANVKSGKNIFGVAGSCKEYQKKTFSITSSSSTIAFSTTVGTKYYYYIDILNYGMEHVGAITVNPNNGWGSEVGLYTDINGCCALASGTHAITPAIFNASQIRLPVESRNESYSVGVYGY